jgi:hypothetical protein
LAVGGHLSHSLSSVVLEGVVFRSYFGYPGVPAVVHADVGPVVEALSLVAARLDALVLVGLGVFVEDFLDKVVDDGLLDVVLIGLNYRSDLVSLDGRWGLVLYFFDGSVGLSLSDVSLEMLVPLAGQVVRSADDAEDLVFYYFGVAEEVGLLVVEVEVVVVSGVIVGITRSHRVARIAAHHSLRVKLRRRRKRAPLLVNLRRSRVVLLRRRRIVLLTGKVHYFRGRMLRKLGSRP